MFEGVFVSKPNQTFTTAHHEWCSVYFLTVSVPYVLPSAYSEKCSKGGLGYLFQHDPNMNKNTILSLWNQRLSNPKVIWFTASFIIFSCSLKWLLQQCSQFDCLYYWLKITVEASLEKQKSIGYLYSTPEAKTQTWASHSVVCG